MPPTACCLLPGSLPVWKSLVARKTFVNANVAQARAITYVSPMSEHIKRRPAEGLGNYKLTTSFPYLVRRVGVRIGELFDRRVAQYGISVSMYRVLASLHEQDGQQLGQLAGMTSIELSTLSRRVGTLVRRGLVTRRRPESNGRIVEIALSTKGRALVVELLPIGAHYESVAIAGLDPSAVALLKEQLRIAYDNLDTLEKELAAPPPRVASRKPLAKPRRKEPRTSSPSNS